ncbi:MAG: L-fucose:H+ symporter permease [Bacteroidales bacterium]|nr:L-fucose:H+ symporter permease [Bacteroidales bacterium]
MKEGISKVVERKHLLSFILITSLFALWGFANDITNPLVAAFRTLLEISNAKASLVQLAFYGGYFTMALPAALFARKYSYKKGIMVGLVLYATGAFLFYPAAKFEIFSFFLIALYILTFGLAFLETTANPYILSMGNSETATRRLNLAQSFNPIGSLTGMVIASKLILDALISDERDAAGNLLYPLKSAVEKAEIRAHDLIIIRNPYLLLGMAVLVILILIWIHKMTEYKSSDHSNVAVVFKRLLKIQRYREGVIAQTFYVAAQIMCWTFIIQYAENLGINKATAQNYNIMAMSLFVSSRFISTALLKYINPDKLLKFFAIGGMITTAGTIFILGMGGLYCLIATSAFMSLMFPTIYAISLAGLGDDVKLGAAGLIMAIVGGALMPPLQGAIIDLDIVFNIPAENISFILPFVCFVVVAIFAYRCRKYDVLKLHLNNNR